MRILIASTHRAVVGGVETYLREVIPALRNRGHGVALLYEQSAPAGEDGIDADSPGLPAWRVEAIAGCGLPAEVVAWRPDVVYLQGLEAPAVEEALLARFPTVLFAHNYHGTCLSGNKRFAFPAARPCQRTCGAGCLLLYHARRCGGLNPATMVRLYRREGRRRALLPRYRAVLVASRHMREEFSRHGVAEDRLQLAPLFPPGQVPDVWPPTERTLAGWVLMVGRLTDVKGGRVLVKALRLASEALRRPLTLVVAGDGPERPALESLARRLGIPTEFVGRVTPARREGLMRQADLLAVPSVWPEPFGLVGIEAGCVGLPAVGFAVGGVPDWLIPGETGEAAPGDWPTVPGLADALVRALADPVHWGRLRLGAWRVARRFTREAHIALLESILEGAVRA